MKIGKTVDPVRTSHSEGFSATAEFGGRKNCKHRWEQRLEGIMYRGPKPAAIPYISDSNTSGYRCLECGRVYVSTYASHQFEPTVC